MQLQKVGTVKPLHRVAPGACIMFHADRRTHLGIRGEFLDAGRQIALAVSLSPGLSKDTPGAFSLSALGNSPVYELWHVSLVLSADPSAVHPGYNSLDDLRPGAVFFTGDEGLMIVRFHDAHVFLHLSDGALLDRPALTAGVWFTGWRIEQKTDDEATTLCDFRLNLNKPNGGA
jgi:hypothetical protein